MAGEGGGGWVVSAPDFRMQQELEEERMRLSLEALKRVAEGTSTNADATFLAAELGFKDIYQQETRA